MIKKHIKMACFVLIFATFAFANEDQNQIQTKQLDPDTTIMLNSNETPDDYDPDVFVGEGNKAPEPVEQNQQNRQEEQDQINDFANFDDISINIPNVKTLYLGVQYTNPTFGLSAKFDLLDDFAIQAIVDFIGDINLYEGRGVFAFEKTKDYSLYVYGGLGFWVYNYISSANSYKSYNYRTSIGFGGGVGVEFELKRFNPKLPPLTITTELGLRMLSLEHYNVVPIGFGIGAYYKF